VVATINEKLTVDSPATFNGIVSLNGNIVMSGDSTQNNTTINGSLTQNGTTANIVMSETFGFKTSGLSIINTASNRICQNYKSNENNTNTFNKYDAQIVVSGKTTTQTQPNNTGTISLNSQLTFLSADSDLSPMKYVLVNCNESNNTTNVYYKSNINGNYIADATVLVNGTTGLIGNKGIYNITSGLINLNSSVVQTGLKNKSVSCINTNDTYIEHFNSNITDSYNSVGINFKADPTKNTLFSDASITVKADPIIGMTTTPALNYGTMNINARTINIGDEASETNILGILNIMDSRIVQRTRARI
jgi:hypothetical protein